MGWKTPFFSRILPLSFNSKLKKDSGFTKPNDLKNFFGFHKPGGNCFLICLRSELSRARGTNFAFFHSILVDILCASRIKKVDDCFACFACSINRQLPYPSIDPNYFGQVQIFLDKSKMFWTRQKTLKIMKTSTFFLLCTSRTPRFELLPPPTVEIHFLATL